MLNLILAGAISLLVNPQTCFAPCHISLVITVEADKANEKLIIELNSDDYQRVSNLDYSNGGPKKLQITYPDVPAGDYEVRVSIHRHDGKSWVAGVATKKVQVAGN